MRPFLHECSMVDVLSISPISYMRNLLEFAMCCCFILFVAMAGMGKTWNGITPLKTTRVDVIKLLGEPKPWEAGQPGYASIPEHFEVDGDRVFITWTSATCFNSGHLQCDEKLVTPDSLVYRIQVVVKEANRTRYENEVASFLVAIGEKDCSISCGTYFSGTGFGYSRAAEKLYSVQYGPTYQDSSVWFSSLRIRKSTK